MRHRRDPRRPRMSRDNTTRPRRRRNRAPSRAARRHGAPRRHDGTCSGVTTGARTENRKRLKNALREKNTLDPGHESTHIFHSGEVGAPEEMPAPRFRCRSIRSVPGGPPSPNPSRKPRTAIRSKREGRRRGGMGKRILSPRRGEGQGEGVPALVSARNRKGEKIVRFRGLSDLFISIKNFFLDSGRVLGYISHSGEVGAPEVSAPFPVAGRGAGAP